MVCLSACTSSVGIALSRGRSLWAGDTTCYAVNGICLPTKLCTSLWMMHTGGVVHLQGVVMLLVTPWLQAGNSCFDKNYSMIDTYDKSGLCWDTLQVELPCGAHCFHLADVYLPYIHAARHVPNHVSNSQLCPCCNRRHTASHRSCLGFVSPVLVFWPQNRGGQL